MRQKARKNLNFVLYIHIFNYTYKKVNTTHNCEKRGIEIAKILVKIKFF